MQEHRGKRRSLRLASEPADRVFAQVIPWEAEVITKLLLKQKFFC